MIEYYKHAATLSNVDGSQTKCKRKARHKIMYVLCFHLYKVPKKKKKVKLNSGVTFG